METLLTEKTSSYVIMIEKPRRELEKMITPRLVKKFLVYCGTRRNIF
jgi:hypothetical protein